MATLASATRQPRTLPAAAAAPGFLARYSELAQAALEGAAMPGAQRFLLPRMAGYQVGWNDSEGAPAAGAGGKLLRPALCLWSCESLGGRAADALSPALALELLHNFTLIHDDVQDGDHERRHRPTVWALWGEAQAINAGDGLHAWAFEVLLRPGPRPQRRLRAARLIAHAIRAVVEGQCRDLAYQGRPGTSTSAYLRMVELKTGALVGAAVEAGAVMAGAPASARRALRRAGRLAGMAFQVRDDWLGSWGDPAATGKSDGGDIARRKLTYAVCAAHAAASPRQRARLERLFREPAPEAAAEPAIRGLLEGLGAPAATAQRARELSSAATSAAREAGLPDARLAEFAELARYFAERDR